MNISQLFREARHCVDEMQQLASMSRITDLDVVRPLMMQQVVAWMPVVPMILMALVGLSIFWVQSMGLLLTAASMILMLLYVAVWLASHDGQLHMLCWLDAWWPASEDLTELLWHKLVRVHASYARIFGERGQMHDLQVLLTVPKPQEKFYVDPKDVLLSAQLLCKAKYQGEEMEMLFKEIGFLYLMAQSNAKRFLPDMEEVEE